MNNTNDQSFNVDAQWLPNKTFGRHSEEPVDRLSLHGGNLEVKALRGD